MRRKPRGAVASKSSISASMLSQATSAHRMIEGCPSVGGSAHPLRCSFPRVATLTPSTFARTPLSDGRIRLGQAAITSSSPPSTASHRSVRPPAKPVFMTFEATHPFHPLSPPPQRVKTFEATGVLFVFHLFSLQVERSGLCCGQQTKREEREIRAVLIKRPWKTRPRTPRI